MMTCTHQSKGGAVIPFNALKEQEQKILGFFLYSTIVISPHLPLRLNVFCIPAEVAAAPERSGRTHVCQLKGCWTWAEIINWSRCTRLWRQGGHIHGYDQLQKNLLTLTVILTVWSILKLCLKVTCSFVNMNLCVIFNL